MMTDEEFDTFVEQAIDQLQRKQDILIESNRLETYPDYWFQQDTGTLQFKKADGKVAVEASIIPIGSFSSRSETWQWAWANQSVIAQLREKAESLKGLFDLTGMDVFQKPTVEADEDMAVELAAMSVLYLESLGSYRIPMPEHQLMMFVAIERMGPPQKS
jgi:hypothetical protein